MIWPKLQNPIKKNLRTKKFDLFSPSVHHPFCFSVALGCSVLKNYSKTVCPWCVCPPRDRHDQSHVHSSPFTGLRNEKRRTSIKTCLLHSKRPSLFLILVKVLKLISSSQWTHILCEYYFFFLVLASIWKLFHFRPVEDWSGHSSQISKMIQKVLDMWK